jgi:hypothetical protein
VALPARFLKKSAAVSTTPTFSATATAIHWFKDTPSSFASRWGSFLDGQGKLQWIGCFAQGFAFFSSSAGCNTGILKRSAAGAKSAGLYVTSPVRTTVDRGFEDHLLIRVPALRTPLKMNVD